MSYELSIEKFEIEVPRAGIPAMQSIQPIHLIKRSLWLDVGIPAAIIVYLVLTWLM